MLPRYPKEMLPLINPSLAPKLLDQLASPYTNFKKKSKKKDYRIRQV
jgi:hypothetical protein